MVAAVGFASAGMMARALPAVLCLMLAEVARRSCNSRCLGGLPRGGRRFRRHGFGLHEHWRLLYSFPLTRDGSVALHRFHSFDLMLMSAGVVYLFRRNLLAEDRRNESGGEC